MPLTDLIVGMTILDGGPSVDKAAVVQQMLLHLAAEGHVNTAEVPAVLDAVMRRESIASTGIGQGVAVPHAKHASITRPLGVLALCRSPVNFDSIDGEPTDIVVLYITPRDQPESQIREAARSSQLLLRGLASTRFRERLRASNSAKELQDLLAAVGPNNFY